MCQQVLKETPEEVETPVWVKENDENDLLRFYTFEKIVTFVDKMKSDVQSE